MSKRLSLKVFGSIANVDFLKLKLPGAPSLVAPHYPPVKGRNWYEGSQLRSASQLIGRVETLEEIMGSLRIENEAVPRLIDLTGIGGIGYFESLVVIPNSRLAFLLNICVRFLCESKFDLLLHVPLTRIPVVPLLPYELFLLC